MDRQQENEKSSRTLKKILKRLVEDGKHKDIIPGVTLEKYGRYIQGNYNDIDAWDRGWPQEVRKWRGHIWDQPAGELVANPMDKFFKYLDIPEINEEYVKNLLNTAKNFHLLGKMDGTLIIVWFDNHGSGTWRLSTRGMIDFKKEFLNDSAVPIVFHDEAEIYLENSKFYRVVNDPTYRWMEEYTFSFELIHPDNRIVSKYEDADFGMHLLSMRHTLNGLEINQFELNHIAEKMHVKKLVSKISGDTGDILRHILNYKETHSDDNISEGFVLRIDLEDGKTHRIKFINDQYLSLKWIFRASSEKYYLRLIQDESFFKVYKTLPKDLQLEARAVWKKFFHIQSRLQSFIEDIAMEEFEPGTREFHEYISEKLNPVFVGMGHAISRGFRKIHKGFKEKHLNCDVLVTLNKNVTS